ncbi:MAG: ABC transporter substrate-binding protein [Thaumarchaeota archaeon]|nr:ABC transporter substrate-binding protein [Nitrososphaerota archaeon]
MIEIELSYWGLLGHLIDGNISLYNKKHPGVRVRASGDGTDYLAFLVDRFSSGKPPDLFQTFNEPNAYYLSKGWAGVLEDYVPEARKYKKEISNEQYRKSIMTPDGRVQGVIYYGAHAAFMYNKVHLDGAAPPTEWDEVITQSKKVKAKGIVERPIALDFAGPGYLEALYSIMVGMNPPQASYLFDEDFNPMFDDKKSPLFVTLRWLSDAANREKLLTKDSTRLGAFDTTYAMGQQKHTFSWLPRYVLPVIDFMSMSRNVSQALNPGYGYISCYTRVYSPSMKALQSGPKKLDALWRVMQYFGGRTDEHLDPDPRGEYRVLKSQVMDCGVPAPADGLWKDKEVQAAMGKWGPLDVLKEQDKKVYNAQCDPWPAPWLQQWVNEWGKSPLKTLLHSVIENETDDAQLLSGLRKVAGEWKTLKREYAKGP